MSRNKRVYTDSGLYHVMLRGINRQQIFFDDEDCEMFLQVLRECKKEDHFQVHAWTLMGNHVHLLLKTADETISLVMKRISGRFVIRYNQKYQRVGHLFQDRFRSEPINQEAYYLHVFRYIHLNPLRAGMETRLGDYPWSSIFCYMGVNDDLTDSEFAMGIFGDKKDLLSSLHTHVDEDMEGVEETMDVPDQIRPYISDDRAVEILLRSYRCKNISDFQKFAIEYQIDACRDALAQGATFGQMSRLTGISKTTLYRKITHKK